MTAATLIVGGGQAASEVAVQLRRAGKSGPITLLSDEMHLPYQRPPLSKGFLAGKLSQSDLCIRPASAYEASDITVRLGARVAAIDRAARRVRLDSGETLPWDFLIIATGGRPRPLTLPGSKLGNVFTLRTISDAQRLRAVFTRGSKLVIVGGGYVGLEVAAVAVEHGLAVTILESATRVLARVAAPVVSAFYETVHRGRGVGIRTGVTIAGLTAKGGSGMVGGVDCGEAGIIDADLVLVGIGLIPNTELAEQADLRVDGGIVVDPMGRTSAEDIYAVGDCTVHRAHGFLKRQVRLESVPNAIEQARSVATAITGRPLEPSGPPWFWSEQYEFKLQMVGLSQGNETIVVRGSIEDASFVAFYLKDDTVIAADAVNKIADFLVAKKLVTTGVRTSKSALEDVARPLKEILASV